MCLITSVNDELFVRDNPFNMYSLLKYRILLRFNLPVAIVNDEIYILFVMPLE